MGTEHLTATEAEAVARRALAAQVDISPWIVVDQARIDEFARITKDDQFIHVDPVRAKDTPFGGTIAHGFLILSLLSHMVGTAGKQPAGIAMGINYGFDKVRFVAPVRSGARVRAKVQLVEVIVRAPGQLQLRHTVTVEIESQSKPALVADWLTLQILKEEPSMEIT